MTQPAKFRSINLLIFSAVYFDFAAYFAIGLSLAILPGYVHLQLGLSTVLAGLMVGLQYIATFATRHRAGRMSDTIGPRQTVRYGMTFCAASGGLMVLSWLLRDFLWLGLGTLACSRLLLGTGESMAATGATMWGIGMVGQEHTAKVISLNGVATYVALAIGAPIGVLLESLWGFGAVGALLVLVAAGSFAAATRMAPTFPPKGEPVPLGQLLRGVSPFGMALALGGMGFGVIATFITLYFAQRHWQGAALSLTCFGLCFVGARLAFAHCIDRYGGFPVAILSFCVEAAGLVVLALGHSQALAYVGSGLTGLGFSMIFPSMGVEATNCFPVSVRGSVLGVYSAFVDGSLFLTGPLAGAVIVHYGYSITFLATAGAILVALAGTIWLASSSRMTVTD
jgi:MFS family permease